MYCDVCNKYRNKLKQIFFKKYEVFLLFIVTVVMDMKKYLKKKNKKNQLQY